MLLEKWLLRLEQQRTQRDGTTPWQPLPALLQLLGSVDQSRFGPLAALATTQASSDELFSKVVRSITTYLVEVELRKPQREYMADLCRQKSIEGLLSLVLFVVVNSPLRCQAVQAIIGFTAEEQEQLMQTIKGVEGKCCKLVEIKEVIAAIEDLQASNSQLREQQDSKREELSCRYSRIDEIESLNRELEADNRQLKEEKQNILDIYDCYSLQEYQLACNTLKQEVDSLSSALSLDLHNKQALEGRGLGLKKELQQCSQTIRQQMEEVERLSSWHQLLKDDSMLSYRQVDNCPEIRVVQPLGDNRNILNLSVEPSRDKKRYLTARTQHTDHKESEESFEEPTTVEFQLQLSLLQEQQQQKQQELDRLKHQLRAQRLRDKRLSSRIGQLKEAHRQHVVQYGL